MEEKYIKIITENTESCKSAHKRLDTLEKNIDGINNLAVAVKEIAMETKATREDVNDMNSRLKNVEENNYYIPKKLITIDTKKFDKNNCIKPELQLTIIIPNETSTKNIYVKKLELYDSSNRANLL